jgi:hypothetical protein
MYSGLVSLILATFLSFAIAGCGHHNKPSPNPQPSPTPIATPSPTPVPQAVAAPVMSFTRVRGMHVQAAQQKTVVKLETHGWFSLPTVEAATIVAVEQNWEGDCQSSPAVTGGNVATITLFGVGQTVDETCSHSWVDNDTDGSKAAGFNDTGKIVFGDGHISNLVVSVEKGTVVQNPVLVTVWVKRSGTVLSTGLTCALAVQNDDQVCQSTASFAVQNLDRVIVTVTRTNGDMLVNLNAAFTKQIP